MKKKNDLKKKKRLGNGSYNVLIVIYGRWKWKVRNVGWSEQEATARINLRRRGSDAPRAPESEEAVINL